MLIGRAKTEIARVDLKSSLCFSLPVFINEANTILSPIKHLHQTLRLFGIIEHPAVSGSTLTSRVEVLSSVIVSKCYSLPLLVIALVHLKALHFLRGPKMELSRFLARADVSHSHAKFSPYEKRQLYGHVFGTGTSSLSITHGVPNCTCLNLCTFRTACLCDLPRHAGLFLAGNWAISLGFTSPV